ncbi:MAG TPA: DoxX family protein [Kiloniellaceae bacterium]
MSSLTSWSPHVLSLLRVASGAAFMAHGTMKWLNFPTRSFPQPEVFSMTGASGAIELIGGALIVLGLFTRPAAFICSGMTAVAYFMVHAPKSFFPVLNGGDAALLFCFAFFYLVFAGPGPWSLDAIMRKKG